MSESLGHWLLRGYGKWSVIEKSSKSLIGHVGLWKLPSGPAPEVGWMSAPAWRRKGYAREAAQSSILFGFEKSCMSGISCIVASDDDISKALAQQLGGIFQGDVDPKYTPIPHAHYAIKPT